MHWHDTPQGKKWRKENKEHLATYNAEWSKNNRAKRNAYMRKWYAEAKANDPAHYARQRRKHSLKRRYNISIEYYDKLLSKQDGHCALCPKTADGERYGFLAVDHCHDTGRVRGLLCAACNLALGKLGDTPDSILRVFKYISAGV